ncbi:DUF5667 domain-containing protein [Kitasatospora sp. NPDC085895]|uniref:DUF5667 domain-containing protein n=1 Tax=Kitasatospora sp. NPDC085895 TaxID=3155057 RepID=UPI00344BFE07
MTANVLEHRRAKAFAEALEAHRTDNPPGGDGPDGSTPGGAHRAGSTAMAELLAVADTLGELPVPEFSAEAKAIQRAQLMAAFEQAFAGGGTPAVPRQRGHRAARAARGRWGRRLAIGGLVAGVAVGGFAGAAAASGGALPGDALYGMKRGLEGLRLDWAGSDSERGALLLEQATTRLDEAQSLLQRSGSPDTLSPGTVEQVRQALDDMHAEALRGRDLLRSVYRSNGSLAPMRQLATFASGQDDRWTRLHDRLPGQLGPQADKVDELFDDISEDVAPLHLEKPGPGDQQGTGAGDGQTSGQASGGAVQGATQGGSGAPAAHGTGTAPNGAAPSTAPQGVGGLVDGLTDGLGGGQSGAPATGGTTGSGASPAPSGSATGSSEGQGITIPPLIPGLLPGLTLG